MQFREKLSFLLEYHEVSWIVNSRQEVLAAILRRLKMPKSLFSEDDESGVIKGSLSPEDASERVGNNKGGQD